MRGKLFGWTAAVLFVSMPLALAQRGMRNYDPSTETPVTGKVKQVKQVEGRHGWNGTHLILKTQTGALEVHVGPSSYIAGQGFSFASGNEVEVLGSKVKVEAGEVLIAREIKKNDKTLVLRNAQGVPEWAGGRRQPN